MSLIRSSFYYKLKAKSSDQMKAETDLVDHIEVVCLKFPHDDSAEF